MSYSAILVTFTVFASFFIRLSVLCSAAAISSRDQLLNSGRSEWEKQLEFSDQEFVDVSDPFQTYISDYRRILSLGGNGPSDEEEIDRIIKDRIEYLRNAPKLTKSPRVRPKHHFENNYYDEQICGILHPDVREDDDAGGEKNGVIVDGSTPPGCEYQDTAVRQQLLCSGSNITDVPRLPLTLISLSVANTRIRQVERADFGEISIRDIKLIHNDITEILPSAFANVNGIFTLEIMDNELEYLAFDIYYGLQDLSALHLDGNRISLDIYKDCGKRNISDIPEVLPNLTFLSLRRNPLQIIPAQMWAGLRKSPLGLLELSYCDLESIDAESFTFLPHLNTLYLGGNPRLMPNLTTAFEGLRNATIEGLSLGDNGLMTYPSEALAIVSHSLKSLDLSENPIQFWRKEDITTPMPNLNTLNLQRCRLLHIQMGLLDMFPKLTFLDLSFNQLTQLPTMTSLPNLIYLNLADNKMNLPVVEGDDEQRTFQIPEYGFENLNRLFQLILTNTKLDRIEKNTFKGLTNLKHLFLENTRLQFIENWAFSDLTNMHSLQMKNNPQLETVNSLTFYGMQNLEFLHLDSCGLSFPVPEKYEDDEEETTTEELTEEEYEQDDDFPVDEMNKGMKPDYSRPFMFLPSLASLYLKNNKIGRLYPELFAGNNQLQMLELDDCEIESWKIPLFPKNLSQGRLNSLDTILPSGINFTFSGNKLSEFTDAMLEDLINFEPSLADFSKNKFFCDKSACKLRDLVFPKLDQESTIPFPISWTNSESYACINYDSEHILLSNLTDETCNKFRGAIGGIDEPLSPEEAAASNWMTIIIVSSICATLVLIGAVVAYKQRTQIRYLIFRAKMNVGKLPMKTKTSLSESNAYDFDIFISYHNEDRDFIIDKFLPEVEGQPASPSLPASAEGEEKESEPKPFRVCLHERDFEAGTPISENIIEAVDSCKKVVIVVTKKYLESQWCIFEMNLAYHRLVESRRKSFVVILLEDIPNSFRTKVLNYLLISRTYLEWPGENCSPAELRRFWTRLRNSLQTSD